MINSKLQIVRKDNKNVAIVGFQNKIGNCYEVEIYKPSELKNHAFRTVAGHSQAARWAGLVKAIFLEHGLREAVQMLECGYFDKPVKVGE